MPDKKLLHKKITEIIKQLEYLSELVKLNQKELFGNARNFYFAERVVERLIGAAIDINMHIISDLSGDVAEDYFESFIDLAKFKILPLKFAKHIAPSTSLRNIIVHEYQSIDLIRFYTALKLALKDYAKYLTYIQKYLSKY